MKALGYTRPLGIGELQHELQLVDVPVPEPGKTQIQIKVKATCINIDDIHIAEGTFFGGLSPSKASPEKPSIPGVDAAGTVVRVGSGISGFSEGDDVLGILMPKPGLGTWAEYCCLEERRALHKPADYSYAEAASCAVGGKTAANAVMSARVSEGQSCVVIGASGGIGSIIVQILHAAGVRVIGVCSGRNTALVGSLGADTVIDYNRGPVAEQLNNTRVDAVIDCIGGKDTEQQGCSILKKSGRFVTLCGPQKYIGEHHVGKAGVARMIAYVSRRAAVSLVSGPRYIMAGIGSSLEPIEKLVFKNSIKPPVDRHLTFDAQSVQEGISHIITHRAQGKVIIDMPDQV